MHRKAVPLGQQFGDAAAVANAPVGFVAEQNACAPLREKPGLVQRQLGFRTGKPGLNDAQNRSQSRRLLASRPSGGVPSARRDR